MCTRVNYDIYIPSLCARPEVYAAREKNGIYIPRDRYLQEEAEKKVQLFSIYIGCHVTLNQLCKTN